LDYGADPLGRNDSTAAFQRAIDAATWSGKTVLVPAGAFAVSPPSLFSKEGKAYLRQFTLQA
jgi:polygalacturonase